MRTIHCDSCNERFYSAAAPHEGTRCPSCAGRLMAVWSAGDVTGGNIAPALAHVPQADPGSYPADRPTYPSLQAFLLADPRRVPSAERDVGLHWRDDDGQVFRAAWVAATGELYTVQSGPVGGGGGHVEILGNASSESALRSALSGWEDAHGELGSVGWLRDRAVSELGGQDTGVNADAALR